MSLDRAPRLYIRRVIRMLAFDTVFVNSTNISTNIGRAMLPTCALKLTTKSGEFRLQV